MECVSKTCALDALGMGKRMERVRTLRVDGGYLGVQLIGGRLRVGD